MLIDKDSFESFWQNNYDGIPPLGRFLRYRFFNDRWFRIHSLPNSKRYADNDEEMRIILNRHNKIIDDLIGHHSNYVLLFSSFSDAPSEICFKKAISIKSINLMWAEPDYYEAECYLNISIENRVWRIGSIDGYIKSIANDERINISGSKEKAHDFLVIDICENRIIAPYDGGIDIILNSMQERDYYKIMYSAWLSSTENGL